MSVCVLCTDPATTAIRGRFESKYLDLCTFHAGALQMILETLRMSDEVKWRPLYKKNVQEDKI